MRNFIVILLAAMAFSGCLDSDPETDNNTNTGDEPMTGNMTVQEPIRHTGNMASIADGGVGLVGICQFPGSCQSFDFTVDMDNTTVDLTLVSTDGVATGVTGNVLYGTDYDLFLFGSSGQLGSSTNPGDQDDVISVVLDAGDYSAQVHSWNDIDGEFTLDIVFS
ncbi:MAG: hypothetical protein ACPHK8_04030 [Thermoplasmatota archaeon]